MRVETRYAAPEDLEMLVAMYRQLETEMTDLHPMWPRVDGLPEPIDEALATVVADPDIQVVVGEIDGTVLGFLIAEVHRGLPQADHEPVGVIRMIFTLMEAREVGIAEAMRDHVMERFRQAGISKFDAYVLPGHRLAKNFFEAGGFSARAIVMHHDDKSTRRRGRDARGLI